MRYGFDYTELDALIEAKIDGGIRRFKDLYRDPDVFALLEKYQGEDRYRRPLERVLDGRLQAIRKQGRIMYDAQDGWGIWDPYGWRYKKHV